MKNTLHIFILLMFLLGAHAQNSHYSSLTHYSLFLQPNMNSDKDYQIAFVYRNQWMNIMPSYQSYFVRADKKINKWSVGFLLSQNAVSKIGIKNTQGVLNASYTQQLAKQSKLSVGMGLGFYQLTLNPNKLTFDNQYTPDIGFDPNQDSGEYFESNRSIVPDFNFGLGFNQLISKKMRLEWAVNLAHLHQPILSFLETNYSLNMKISTSTQLLVAINDKTQIAPFILFARQCCEDEWIMGLNYNYTINPTTKLYLGIAHRYKDAFILGVGYSFNDVQLRLNYDINTSALLPATRGQGALEMGLIYQFSSPTKAVNSDIVEVIDQPNSNNTLAPKQKDSDLDGIEDWYDACPNIPGMPENRGCPMHERDTDGDGIIDAEDLCVYMKGIRKFKGCPDTDNDEVPDTEDHCPFLKGVKSAYGCPEKILTSNSDSKTTPLNRLNLMAIVEFDTDKSIIKSEFLYQLNEVITFVKSNPYVKIILSGHTDSEGSDAYNYALSYRRNKAVQEYFINNGVSVQIEFHSYGETKPILQNDSTYGKAKNRRVEIIISDAQQQ